MSDRCTGDCCRVFYLPFSPEELQENLRASRAGESQDANGHFIGQDIETVANMVIHLGAFDRNPVTLAKIDGLANYYTCKHLQPNGDCGIYENRPRVCSGYPYGNHCNYPGCTWKDAAEKTRGL
jgi:Fe-S-cluster containining protein